MSSQTGHPRGLYLLFFTEMWERFSYYGMRAILVLFLTKQLMMDKAFSSEIYGSFTGLVYLTPIIGGYMADRYWGNRKSIILGGLLMAVGQFMLFFSGSLSNTLIMYIGLGFLVFGNGFFKPNISTMVGQLYPDNDSRLDAAYTIFYMGINLGAFIAPIICGWLGEDIAFKWGFFAAGVGMLISVVSFQWLKNKYLLSPTGDQIGVEPNKARHRTEESVVEGKLGNRQLLAISIGSLILFGLFYKVVGFDFFGAIIFAFAISIPATIILDKSLNSIEKDRIWVIFIAAFFVIFFWSAFEQAGASLTFFADEQTNRTILGWEMPASWFQSFNAAFVVIFAPMFSAMWLRMGDRQPSSITKQAIGLALLALGYLYIAFGVNGVDATAKVSIVWLTGLYLIHTFGELCLSPIGLSMVNKLAPARLASLLMGVWFLANATANKFAGMLSALYPEEGKPSSFIGYTMTNTYDFFLLFVVMAGIASLVLFLLSKKLQVLMHGIK
ncbi:MAG: peptide MFS transporter [Bacteroidota bacterium]|nr:peptide MFS transporter [Bacteroidota bacterium]